MATFVAGQPYRDAAAFVASQTDKRIGVSLPTGCIAAISLSIESR